MGIKAAAERGDQLDALGQRVGLQVDQRLFGLPDIRPFQQHFG